MAKYVKIPLEVDAFQWKHDIDEFKQWVNSLGDNFSDHFKYAVEYQESPSEALILKSPNNESYHVIDKWWVIRDNKNMYHLCNPYLFPKIYREIDFTKPTLW